MHKRIILTLLLAAVTFAAVASAMPQRKVWRWSAPYTNRIFKATAGKDKFGHKPPAFYDNMQIESVQAINDVKCHGVKGRRRVKGIPVFSRLACVVDAQMHLAEPDEKYGLLDVRLIYSLCITPLSKVKYLAKWYTDSRLAPCF